MKRNPKQDVTIPPNTNAVRLRKLARQAEEVAVAAKAKAREAKARLKEAKKEAKDLRRAARKAKRALRKAAVAWKKAEAETSGSKVKAKAKPKGAKKPIPTRFTASHTPKSLKDGNLQVSSKGKDIPGPSEPSAG
jgi:hypothetical protein